LLFTHERVIGAQVMQAGEMLELRAERETILSAGAFNSPKLLMLSVIGPADALHALGITVRLDHRAAIGQNLRDHVSYRMNYACSRPVTAYAHTRPLRGAKALLEYAASRRGIIASTSFPTGGFFRSDDALEIPGMQMGLCMGLLPEGGCMLPDREGFTVTVRQGRPASRGEARLRSADPAVPPSIAPRHFSEEDDMRVLMRGVRRLRPIFANPNMRALIDHEIMPGQAVVEDDDRLTDNIRAVSKTTHHFVGTCRMGGDPESVVDPELRVRGVDGLRIADASILPTHINGNTHAPKVMIAEKAAAMILAASVRTRAPA
jgi:choline dehydrogenase